MNSILSSLEEPWFRWALGALLLVFVYRKVLPRLSLQGRNLDADGLLSKLLGNRWIDMKVDREVARLLKDSNFLAAGRLYEEVGRDTEAVDAYLKGQELTAAGVVYERLRKVDKAADLYLQAGDYKRAAKLLVEAGRPAKAAALLVSKGNKLDAARLYLDAKEPEKAASLFLEAGFPQRAAEAFEQAGSFGRAAECYERHFNENVTFSTAYSATAPSKDRVCSRQAGQMWERVGELGRAVDIYAQGLYFKEAADAASRLGAHARAAEYFERAELLAEAAESWQRAGNPDNAAQRRGDVALRSGESEQAARHFVEARDYLRAAELFESIGLFADAAEAYAAGDSHGSAGGAFLRAGRKDLAAGAYERGSELETAARLFQETGQTQKAAELFEKAGLTFYSGQAAAVAGRHDEAIALLQRVEPHHEHYAEATGLLVRLFVETHQPELAVGRVQRALGDRPVGRDTLGLYYWLARAHESAGRTDQAHEHYREILAEDVSFEDVALRLRRAPSDAPTGVAARPPAEQAARAVRAGMPGHIGKYEIVASLGKGAMGEVYRARDQVLERDVALKVMAARVADDPELKQRFEREARSVARLAHPNVVVVHDLGYDDDGAPFIAMELLRGRDLRTTLREQTLDLATRIEVVLQVLAGLAHAHDAGIVHRDIKPANVQMLDGGSVKIVDFGVARLVSTSMTGSGAVMGTADYMSPEQVQGQRVDGRSDLFGVGSMLYEMLTGARPFTGDSVVATFFKINNEAPDLRRLPTGSEHAGLRQIVEKALAKDVEQRYQSAAEFAAALRDWQMQRLSAAGRAQGSWPPLGAAATPPAAAPRAASEPPRDSRFVEFSLLGEGALGAVYRARDTKHDRVVALRAVPLDVSSQDYAALVAELKRAAQVSHPNLARVLGVFESEQRRYVVTELVEGKDCAVPLRSGRRMGLGQVLGLGHALGGALDAAHTKGLTHGAVQPSNLVFSEGRFKLTDLGLGALARALPPSPYRPAGAYGPGADLFAATAVLYHLYTGVAPSPDPEPPGRLRPESPASFDALVARGLSADPVRGFGTAGDLAAALAAVEA